MTEEKREREREREREKKTERARERERAVPAMMRVSEMRRRLPVIRKPVACSFEASGFLRFRVCDVQTHTRCRK